VNPQSHSSAIWVAVAVTGAKTRTPDGVLYSPAAKAKQDGEISRNDFPVVGHIASFDLEGHREVTYWIGREDWGRGIATRALQEFLQLEATRPLYAHAASDNAASIRVLTKCGFLIVGEGREFAHGRNEGTDEVVLQLDA
jgi:RimJ/RimL family protein N-acetyltransferase